MNIPLKTKVRYWFYFLRLAHKSQNPTVKSNLLKSAEFYSRWGDYRNITFENWWKDHSHLFTEKSSIRKMTVEDKVENDGALYLRVPLTFAPTSVAKAIARIYEEEYQKQNQVKKKVKKSYGGLYNLTSLDSQISQFDYYLLFAEKVYLPLVHSGLDLKVKNYTEKAEIVFSPLATRKPTKRIEKLKRIVPFTSLKTSEDAKRKLTSRYIKFSRNLLLNVSNGIFPGEYDSASIKKTVTPLKTTQPDTRPVTKRGVPQSRYQVKTNRKDGVDPYADRGPRMKSY